MLLLAPGQAVIILPRVLEYSGEPVVLDEVTLPAALFRGLTRRATMPDTRLDATACSKRGSACAMLQRRRADQGDRRRPGAPAEILQVAAGSPLLAVERVAFTYRHRPVEWRRGLCQHEKAPLPEPARLDCGTAAGRRFRAYGLVSGPELTL